MSQAVGRGGRDTATTPHHAHGVCRGPAHVGFRRRFGLVKILSAGDLSGAVVALAFPPWHPCGGGVRCNGALASFFP